MQPLPLNLCVFDTAKQHFDRFDVYQRAIQGLANKIPLNLFANRYVHIKVVPDKEGEKTRAAQEMGPFYKQHGFQVHVTEGQWSHFTPSHQQSYCRDMIAMYGHVVDQRIPYTLWLESDWLFDTRGGELVDYLELGMRYLDATPDCLSVRIPRFVNEVFRLQGLLAKHGMDVKVQPADAPFETRFYRHNDNFSCNPNICRTRDLYAATRMLELHFEQMSFHAEMGFTHCLKWLSRSHLPYAIYNPLEINALHIGTKVGEEDTVPATWIS